MYPSVVHTKPKRYILRDKGRKIERTIIDIPENDIDTFYRAMAIDFAKSPSKRSAQTPSKAKAAPQFYDAEGFGHAITAAVRHGEIKAGTKLEPVIKDLEEKKEQVEVEAKEFKEKTKFFYSHKDRIGQKPATSAADLLDELQNDDFFDAETMVAEYYDKNGNKKFKVLADIKQSSWGPYLSQTPGTELRIYENEGTRGGPVVDETRPVIRVKKPNVVGKSAKKAAAKTKHTSPNKSKKKFM